MVESSEMSRQLERWIQNRRADFYSVGQTWREGGGLDDGLTWCRVDVVTDWRVNTLVCWRSDWLACGLV